MNDLSINFILFNKLTSCINFLSFLIKIYNVNCHKNFNLTDALLILTKIKNNKK